MDAISMACNDIKNVVALMGVVISKVQIEALRKLNSRVVLMLDSDNAGATATLNVGDEIYKSGLDLYVVRLSGAKDPDEYIRKFGREALLDNIHHAKKYLDFKLDTLKENRNLQDVGELTEYIKEAINVLNLSSDIEREVAIGKLAKEYNIDPEVIKKNLTENNKPKETNVPLIKEKTSRYDLAVKNLIYGMLLDKEFYRIYSINLGYLNNKIECDVVSMINAYIKKNNDISIAGFLDYVEVYPEIKEYVLKVISVNNLETLEKKDFCGILDAVIKCINDEEIKKLKNEIKNEVDVSRKLELMKKLTELKKGSGMNERN